MAKADNSDVAQSPCVHNCCLNEDDICLGCFRSIDEITSWNYASNSERLTILENTRQRKQASG